MTEEAQKRLYTYGVRPPEQIPAPFDIAGLGDWQLALRIDGSNPMWQYDEPVWTQGDMSAPRPSDPPRAAACVRVRQNESAGTASRKVARQPRLATFDIARFDDGSNAKTAFFNLPANGPF